MTFRPEDHFMDVLSYDPGTGIFHWKVTMGRHALKGSAAGSKIGKGYLAVSVYGRQYYAHRLAVFFMLGRWPEAEVDHKNCDREDNRWSNLRLCTRSQNKANRRPRKGLKGIEKTLSGKWAARVGSVNAREYLGSFDCPAAAHLAYVVAADRVHGEFARSKS